MKQFLVISFFFLTTTVVYGQTMSWARILRSADSVYLISHGLIKGTSFVALDSSGKEVNQPLLIDGKLNSAIVEKKKVLNAKDITELITILSYKSNEVPDEAKCYIPLNAIIMVTGRQLSYIEMSFSCQIYGTSKDLTLPPIQNRTWKRLIAFFKSHGI